MKTSFLSVLVPMLLWGSRAYGQAPSRPDSTATAATHLLARHYTSGLGSESRLYNGPEYVNYVSPYNKDHQYFGESAPQEGSLEYDGAVFFNVPLRYDLVRGQVVLTAPSGALNFQLIDEKIVRFSLGAHSFVRLVAPSEESLLRTGFYEELTPGAVRLLAAHRKNVQQRSTPTGMQGEVLQKTSYFVEKNQSFHKVGSAGSVLKLFPENKAQLRSYLKAEKLSFRPANREKSLTALVRYAASLARTAPAAN
jgi:hypothetical protein